MPFLHWVNFLTYTSKFCYVLALHLERLSNHRQITLFITISLKISNIQSKYFKSFATQKYALKVRQDVGQVPSEILSV